MRTRHRLHILALREESEHLRTFLNLEALGTEHRLLRVVGRDSRGIDYHRVLLVEKWRRDQLHIILVVDGSTLCFKTAGKVGCSAIIARNLPTFVEEVACQSTHSDTANAEKIDSIFCHCTNP